MPRKAGESPYKTTFGLPQLGTVPRLPRVKGFPKNPRTPQRLKPPGETDLDRFQARFEEIRNSRYPTITRPEYMVFEWLEKEFGPNSQGRDWEYTTATLVSAAREGGIEVDFNIYSGGLMVWQVQGEYFHFATAEQQSGDLVEKLQLQSAGYVVVNMLASMIEQDVNRVCLAGLRGEQLYTDPIVGGYVPPAVKAGGGW